MTKTDIPGCTHTTSSTPCWRCLHADMDAFLVSKGINPRKFDRHTVVREVTDRLTRSYATPARTVTEALFIEDRPRADRYVYVLLSQLTELDSATATAERDMYEATRATLKVSDGSAFINHLKAKIASYNGQPVTPPAPVADAWTTWRELAGPLAEMGGQHGAGFAVDTEDGAVNKIAFWRIVPGRNGDGRFFLRQVLGGSGAVRVRMSVEAMISVARKIVAADPKAAMLRYGQELGECGHCYRTLTNDESRMLGIGPRCRNKKGW